jgi:hypothetical protein
LRAQLVALRAKLRDEVLRVRGKDGLFPTGGPLTYFNGPSYVQPLFGLGLVPLIDSFSHGSGGERKFAQPALGILDEHLLAAKEARFASLPLSSQGAHGIAGNTSRRCGARTRARDGADFRQ